MLLAVQRAGDSVAQEGESRRDTPKDETVEFIFEYTKDAPDRQARDIESLDTKVVQVFSAASVVIGLLGISRENLSDSAAANAFLALAVVSYVVAAGVALYHLYPTEQRRAQHVEDLWPTGWDKNVKELQHALIESIRGVNTFNKNVLVQKRNTLVAAVAATGVEVLFVGLTLVSPGLTGPSVPLCC
jgi:hypothetical protein